MIYDTAAGLCAPWGQSQHHNSLSILMPSVPDRQSSIMKWIMKGKMNEDIWPWEMKNELKNWFTPKCKVFKYNLTIFPNQWISFIHSSMQQMFIDHPIHTKGHHTRNNVLVTETSQLSQITANPNNARALLVNPKHSIPNDH